MDGQRAGEHLPAALLGVAGRAVYARAAGLLARWPARLRARLAWHEAWFGVPVALLGLVAIGYKPTWSLWSANAPWVLFLYQNVLLGAGDLCLLPLAMLGVWALLRWRSEGRRAKGEGRTGNALIRPSVLRTPSFSARIVAVAGGALVACMVASAIGAQAPLLSLVLAAQVAAGVVALIAVASCPPLGRWLLIGMGALVLVQVPFIALQLATQSTFPSGRLFDGWSREVQAEWPGATVVIGPNGTRWQRAVGTFPHPNILGGFAACVVVLALPTLLRRDWIARAVLFVWASAWVELILTFSRGALLAVALGCGVWLLGRVNGSKKLEVRSENETGVGAGVGPPPTTFALRTSHFALRRILLLALPPLVAVAAGGVLLGAAFWQRYAPMSALNAPATSERRLIAGVATTLIREYPLLGVGAGNFTLAELRPQFDAISVEPVHTVPLLVAAESGLPAAVAWLALLLGPPLARWRRDDWARRCARLALPLTLLALAALDHYCWTYAPGRALFWLALGVCLAMEEVRSTNEEVRDSGQTAVLRTS